jgi:hypothetical protein
MVAPVPPGVVRTQYVIGKVAWKGENLAAPGLKGNDPPTVSLALGLMAAVRVCVAEPLPCPWAKERVPSTRRNSLLVRNLRVDRVGGM